MAQQLSGFARADLLRVSVSDLFRSEDVSRLERLSQAYRDSDPFQSQEGFWVRHRADGVWVGASLLYRGDDRRRLAQLHRLALAAHVPLLATNEVLYHHPARRPLQDVLTCIREKTTIEAVGTRLQANAERHLKPSEEMARLFRDFPQAIAETLRFADRIHFSLDQLKYQYPDEPVPPDNPLLGLDNVVLTPHMGSAVASVREVMANIVVDNVVALIDGKTPPNCVNPQVFDQ